MGRVRQVAIAVGAILAVAVLVGLPLVGVAGNPFRRGPDLPVVLRVNGEPIFLPEYLAILEDTRSGLLLVQVQANRLDLPPEDREYFQAQGALMEEAGLEAVALAHTVAITALFVQARQQGKGLAWEEAVRRARQQRAQLPPEDQRPDSYWRLVEASGGEDRFWEVVVPRGIQKFATAGEVLAEAGEGLSGALGGCRMALEALRSARVEVVDASPLAGATLEQALRYQEAQCENLARRAEREAPTGEGG